MVKPASRKWRGCAMCVAHFLPDTPITKRLADVRAPFVGATASLTLDTNRRRDINIQRSRWPQAEKGYWGETDYNSDDDASSSSTRSRSSTSPSRSRRRSRKAGAQMSGADEFGAHGRRRERDFPAGQRAHPGSTGARFRFRKHQLVNESRTAHRHRAEDAENATFTLDEKALAQPALASFHPDPAGAGVARFGRLVATARLTS